MRNLKELIKLHRAATAALHEYRGALRRLRPATVNEAPATI